jgi:Flp pilus assembly protein TadG
MGRTVRTGGRRTRGQAVVELAVAAPLLFLMLWGMIDFGRAYFQYIALVNAARDGARFAATSFISGSSTDPAPQGTIQGRVQIAAGGLTVPNDGTHIVVQFYDTHCAAGCATTPKLCAHWDFATAKIAWDPGYSAPLAGTQSCPFEGDAVKVTAKYDFKPTTPLIGNILGALTLNTFAETRIE